MHAYQDGKQLTLADLGSAALTGAVGGAIGGAGGAILGKAVTAVGAKLAGPITKLFGRAAQEGEEEAAQAVGKAATQEAETGVASITPRSDHGILARARMAIQLNPERVGRTSKLMGALPS